MLPDRGECPDLPAGATPQVTFTNATVPAPTTAALTFDEALVVIVKTTAGRQRRRVFLSLHAATAAVARARAAGQPVALIFCTLVPVSQTELASSDLAVDEAL